MDKLSDWLKQIEESYNTSRDMRILIELIYNIDGCCGCLRFLDEADFAALVARVEKEMAP